MLQKNNIFHTLNMKYSAVKTNEKYQNKHPLCINNSPRQDKYKETNQ